MWHEDIVRALARANDTDKGTGPPQPLHAAARDGDAEGVARLLGEGATLEV